MFYARWQARRQRVSAGASIKSYGFYLKPYIDGEDRLCYFSSASFSPEIIYEYIINDKFYIAARAGISAPLTNGVYTPNRKEITYYNSDGQKKSAPILEIDRKVTPFFNIGVSYRLFK